MSAQRSTFLGTDASMDFSDILLGIRVTSPALPHCATTAPKWRKRMKVVGEGCGRNKKWGGGGGEVLRTPKRRKKILILFLSSQFRQTAIPFSPRFHCFLFLIAFGSKYLSSIFCLDTENKKSSLKNIFLLISNFFLIFQVWWENLVFDFVSSSTSIEKQVLSKIIGNFFEGLIWSQSYETLRVKIQVNFTSQQEQFSRQIHA